MLREKQSNAPHTNQGSEHETHNDPIVGPILNLIYLLARNIHLCRSSPRGCQRPPQRIKYRARKQAGQLLATGLSRAITMVASGDIHTWLRSTRKFSHVRKGAEKPVWKSADPYASSNRTIPCILCFCCSDCWPAGVLNNTQILPSPRPLLIYSKLAIHTTNLTTIHPDPNCCVVTSCLSLY